MNSLTPEKPPSIFPCISPQPSRCNPLETSSDLNLPLPPEYTGSHLKLKSCSSLLLIPTRKKGDLHLPKPAHLHLKALPWTDTGSRSNVPYFLHRAGLHSITQAWGYQCRQTKKLVEWQVKSPKTLLKYREFAPRSDNK